MCESDYSIPVHFDYSKAICVCVRLLPISVILCLCVFTMHTVIFTSTMVVCAYRRGSLRNE